MRHTQAPAGGASEPAHGGSKRYVSRHLERYRQIAEVLSRHGLGFVVGVVGLSRWVPFHRGVLGHERRQEPYTTPEHLRLAIEELGPTFIKLGQLLSTRSDIVPAEYLHELSKLQDAGRPVQPSTIRALIESELGATLEELFASFDTEPVASASIGQAHLATLPDGTEVVVKVRRPNINAMIETDLEILQNLANIASRRWQAAANYNFPGLVSQFALTLRRELDYLSEGRNAERFAVNFAGQSGCARSPCVLDDHDVPSPHFGEDRRDQGGRPGWPRSRSSRPPRPRDQGGRCGAQHGFRARVLPRRSAPGQPVHRAGRSHRADRLRHGRRGGRRAAATARRAARRPHQPRCGEIGRRAAGAVGGEATGGSRAVPGGPDRIRGPLQRATAWRGEGRGTGIPPVGAAAEAPPAIAPGNRRAAEVLPDGGRHGRSTGPRVQSWRVPRALHPPARTGALLAGGSRPAAPDLRSATQQPLLQNCPSAFAGFSIYWTLLALSYTSRPASSNR